MNQCKNCRTNNTGNFCSHCGQKADTHHFTVKHLIHELVHAVTHADKSLFGFIRAMLTHPGQTVKNYLEGQRKRYFSPFTAFILMMGLQLLVLSMLKHPVSTVATMEELKAIRIEEFIHKNMKLMFIFLLPMLSFLTWLFYRRYNYAEHFVINIFNAGMVSFLFTILYVTVWICNIDNRALGYFNFSISFLYATSIMWGLFADFPKWKVVLYQLLVTIIYYTFTILLVWLMIVLFID